jgi:hypothetical protein
MSISASVGKKAANRRPDVVIVQKLLNAARRQDRLALIAVDGLVGLQTIDAISAFQKRYTTVANGRVDPDGPTITKLDETFDSVSEPQIRSDLLHILDKLDQQLALTGSQLPAEVQTQLEMLRNNVEFLAVGCCPLNGGGFANDPSFRWADLGGADQPQPVLTAGPAAAGAPVAAMAMLFLALMAMLMLIHLLPHISEALDDLVNQIRILLSKAVDTMEEIVEQIEDMIKRNFRAGLLCAAEIEAFRQASRKLLDWLESPEIPKDELGKRRYDKQAMELYEEFKEAAMEVAACLAANGAQ